MTKSVNQLINFFRPVGYLLNVDARPGQRDFRGQLIIAGNQVKGKKIRLHAKGLDLTNVKVNYSPAKVVRLDNDEIELLPKENQKLRPDHAADLLDRWDEKCDTLIALGFSGQMADNAMHGLYPCYYEIDGEKKELLATQFESHHAREVFPCVDEPAAKAKFLLQINTAPEFQVLSNMPAEEQKTYSSELNSESRSKKVAKSDTDNNWISDQVRNDTVSTSFQMTPKMSTYLLAFVIGDLQKFSTKTNRGIEVNIFATKAQEPESLEFAAEVAKKSIDFYEKYFGVEYPLPKSDHVALPDFSSGAMENWGLITYRETCLLADKNAALANKQYIATVIAHELAHQWFGNLVTMKWWDDLWLNESFAELMMHLSIDKLFPQYRIWNDFDTGPVISALRRDALAGVQPVRQNVSHPDEISTLFDPAIVYAKGARLLGMLMNFIGEDAFRSGLKKYFGEFAYQNTSADDLWNCLTEASGQDVAALMTPWLTRPGYPLVHAELTDDEKIRLTQERFFADGSHDNTIEPWPIPLFSNDKNAPKIFDARETTFTPDNLEKFQLNVGNHAHYISIIEKNLHKKLTYKISDLSETDRIKTLNEMILLYRAGAGDTADAIDLLLELKEEKSHAVQEIMSLFLSDLAKFTENDDAAEEARKKLVREIRGDLFRSLGVKKHENDDENTLKLRALIASSMAWNGDATAIKKLLEIYAANKHSLTKIDGDFRGSVLWNAIKNGGDDEFDYLLDIYKTSSDADLKQAICGALTASEDPQRIDEILNFIDKLDIVKPQDVQTWYVYMLSNRHARAETWSWMTSHWPWIEETFSGDKSYDAFPIYAGTRLLTRSELSEFDKFFAPIKKQPALTRAIEVGHNDIAARVEWLERDKLQVKKRLATLL